MSVWEHGAGLGSDGSGPAGAINEIGFAVAMAGYVAVGVGLYLGAPGGDRRMARVFPALVALAWTARLAGLVIGVVTPISDDANVLLPIGGLAQAIGLLGLGITTVAARRWTGWRRFWALGFAVFYVGSLFVPAIAGVEPGVITEVAWALGYSGLGFAMLTSQPGRGPNRIVRVLFGAAVVALLAATAVVTVSSASDEGPAGSAPTVQAHQIYGGADSLERQAESTPHYGSADSLERQAGTARHYGSADSLERQAGTP
jgi:hypothetical protein